PANSTIYDDGADSGIATLAADTTGAADTVPECLTTVATVATEAAALARATGGVSSGASGPSCASGAVGASGRGRHSTG
ncbi:hypothetical protein, partial [Mycobacterium marinum]|uniref:hypothetical protein n=1 Tax=Mycobacterium marinum TaxID=1781 RepID=UPI0035687280